ncbi:hypothetical protein ACFV99_19865 [Streptomyces sp. NPDC059944]|uniref:hypothetical protein n=1 Tax=unclassified Streptomyces TaxID=2593676 RepID=UPI0036359585
MRKDPPQRPPKSPVAGINDVEGFLLLQAELEAARREAERFTSQLDWLTTAQREDVARHYIDERKKLTQMMLTTVAWRSRQLREEYETRYGQLRSRLRKVTAVIACSAVLWCGCLAAWASWATGD